MNFKRQHIVHVAYYGNPAAGSFVPMMCALGKHFHQQGHRFTLVSSAAQNATWVNATKASLDVRIIRSKWEVVRMINHLKPDIVHCHYSGLEIASTIGTVLYSGRLFWQLHSSRGRIESIWAQTKSFLKYRFIGARVESFLTVSQALASEAAGWGVPRAKLKVLRVAIDTERFRPPSSLERSMARSSLDIAPSERVLVFFGRDSHIKGADYLVNALKRISGITIIGVGLRPDVSEALDRSRNRLITVDHERDVRKLYWAADRLVMPSRWEGMPFTLLESLSCGLPALTSQLACFLEVGPDMPGLLRVDVANADEFARRIQDTGHESYPIQHSLIAKQWSFENFVRSIDQIYARASNLGL